jgi:hypothetical protein
VRVFPSIAVVACAPLVNETFSKYWCRPGAKGIDRIALIIASHWPNWYIVSWEIDQRLAKAI